MGIALVQLPDEILLQIFEELETKDSLKVRHVFRRLHGHASSCFRTFTFSVPKDGLWNYLEARVPLMPLTKHVRTVHIVPTNALRLLRSISIDRSLYQYDLALNKTCEFPALRSIHLSLAYFDCIFIEEPETSDFDDAAPVKALRKLFEVARRKAIKELELDMVAPLHLPITSSSMFKQCMRSVEILILHTDSWYCDEGWHLDDDHVLPESTINLRAHQFIQSVGEWIGQSQDILEVLRLSFENYAGYYPRLYLRTIHYSRLKVLDLSCVTISHAAQVDWILGHGRTLATLYLQDCPLITFVETYQELDDKHYPIPGEDTLDVSKRKNDLLWNGIFDSFCACLIHLKNFRITFTWMDPEINCSVTGLAPQRYKSYIYGEIMSNVESVWFAEGHHQADFDAHVRLLRHTGSRAGLLKLLRSNKND